MMLLSLIMHSHILNTDLIGIHVWRQTQTQTVIDNFAAEDFNILNPKINDHAHTDRIMRMEFPIMQWVFAIFYKAFGQQIIISRLLTLLLGFCSVLGMYRLCYTLFNNRKIGVLAAWTFSFSPVFYYYTANPLPDNLAMCCAIWSFVFYFQYFNDRKVKHIIFSGLMLMMATMAKLPFVLYGLVDVVFLIAYFRKDIKLAFTPALVYGLFLIPPAVWYINVIPTWHGNGVVKGIFDTSTYASSEVLNIITGTLSSMLPELLLNYGSTLFFLAGLFFFFKKKLYRSKYYLSIFIVFISVCLYYLYEVNMITLVHDYYMFPFLPFLFVLVAYGAYKLLNGRNKILKAISILALIILPITAFLRVDSRWNTTEPGFNHVYYDHKDELRALVNEDAYCVVGNDISHYILLYYLNRKGWTFDSDYLNEYDLKFFISKGAKYLFTDSPVDENPNIKPFLNEKIYEQENLRVYTLQMSEHI